MITGFRETRENKPTHIIGRIVEPPDYRYGRSGVPYCWITVREHTGNKDKAGRNIRVSVFNDVAQEAKEWSRGAVIEAIGYRGSYGKWARFTANEAYLVSDAGPKPKRGRPKKSAANEPPIPVTDFSDWEAA